MSSTEPIATKISTASKPLPLDEGELRRIRDVVFEFKRQLITHESV